MVGMRTERARAHARNLLETRYPVPEDVEHQRLRELAIDYVREADRLQAERKGRGTEASELISTALDAIARDYFVRAVVRAGSKENAKRRGGISKDDTLKDGTDKT
jgi:hypothetical protein